MGLSRLWLFIGFLSVFANFHYGMAQAQEKLVFLVGAAAGGGHDALARMLGRHMASRIPGTSIEVVNITGEGGKVVAKLISESPADGTVIAMLPSSVLLDQFLGEGTRTYDLAHATYIGKVTSDTRIFVRGSEAPFSDFSGLKAQKTYVPVSVGGTPSAGMYEVLLMNALFDLHLQPLSLEDANARRSAVFLGGLAATHGSLNSLRGMLDHETFSVVLQLSSAPAPDLKDAAKAIDLIKDEKEKRLLGVVDTIAGLGRLIVAPPNLPDDKAKVLRDLFDQTMDDAVFQGESELFGFTLDPASGVEVTKRVSDFLAGPAEIRTDFLEALTCGRKRAESEAETC